MNTKNTNNQWLHYYQDAARMRLDIEIIRNDIKFQKKEGCRIFYAVDTNVIFYYARPCGELRKYAKVFRDENDELTLNNVSILLADYIFLNGLLSENDYFLYPKPIIGEFHSIYIDTEEEAKEKNKIVDELGNLKEITRRIKNFEKGNTEAESQLIDYLTNHCPNLVSYLHNEKYTGIAAVIQRMGILGSKSKLRNMDANTTLPIPDKSDLKVFKKPWRKFHKLVKNQNREDFTVQNDIKTLAWITFVNNYFETNFINMRLLYISGDKTIHKLANNLANSEEINYNFLRHPRQYINFTRLSGEKIAHSLDEKLSLLKEFQVLIDDFLEPLRIDSNGKLAEPEEYLKNLSACYEGKNNRIDKIIDLLDTEESLKAQYNELKAKREKLLSLSTMSRLLTTSDKASELAIVMHEKGINQLLIDKRKEIFNDVVNTLSGLGLFGFITEFRESIDEYLKGLVNNDEMNHWSRGPVSLKRDKDKFDEDGFFEQIHETLFEEAWVTLFKIVNQESPYIKLLIYALVAADAGQWGKAREYCVKAVDEQVYPLNHEALYFLAITLRHDCQKLEDYQSAKVQLHNCKNAWGNRYPERGEDLRFDSEELALATAYFNYKKFIWPDVESIDNEPSLSEIWVRLEKLAKDIDTSTNQPPTIRLRINKQVYSNLCCLFIVDKYREKSRATGVIEENDGRDAYIKLQKLITQKNSRPSYFIHFLVAFLTWHFDKTNDEEIWQDALRETHLAYENHQIRYEEDKYTYFKEILLDYGDSQGWKWLPN